MLKLRAAQDLGELLASKDILNGTEALTVRFV